MTESMPKYYFEGDFSAFAPLFADGSYAAAKREFAAGDLVSAQNETLRKGYFIVSGILQLKIGTEIGQERTLALFGPGSIFPIGMNEHHYRMEYAMVERALTALEVYEFSYTELRRMADEHIELANRMIEHYCDLTSFLFYDLSLSSYGNAMVKVANVLYALDGKMGKGGTIPLSQTQIAEVAGISRVQVARAYRTLASEGIVSAMRNGVKVLDRAALAPFCGEGLLGQDGME